MPIALWWPVLTLITRCSVAPMLCHVTLVLSLLWVALPHGEGSFLDRDSASGRKQRRAASGSSGGLFDFNMVDHEVDLEASHQPINEIAGRFEVLAMPPPKEKGGEQCPLCLSAPPALLPSLYCSAKLSAKVRFRNKHQLQVLADVTPAATDTLSTANTINTINTTDTTNTVDTRERGIRGGSVVSFTMKPRCQCHSVYSGDSVALMVVTPPRFFNLRSIQIIHLDHSITLLPWNSSEPFINSLPMSPKECYRMLTTT